MNITWNSEKYASNFSFVAQYGAALIELIDSNAKSVLDLGCGTGELSQILTEKGFLVTGMDASNEQLEIARKNFPKISFFQADATKFSLSEPVDVVFSNAMLHWIEREKQPDLLNCVHCALKENGQFIFEMGGFGNNRLIHGAFAKIFSEFGYTYQKPFYFPTIGEYAQLLEKAGFEVKYALLFDRPTPLEGKDGLKDWIHMFIKTPFACVKQEDQERIIQRVVENLRCDLYKDGIWYSDYVRLRIKAVKTKAET